MWVSGVSARVLTDVQQWLEAHPVRDGQADERELRTLLTALAWHVAGREARDDECRAVLQEGDAALAFLVRQWQRESIGVLEGTFHKSHVNHEAPDQLDADGDVPDPLHARRMRRRYS